MRTRSILTVLFSLFLLTANAQIAGLKTKKQGSKQEKVTVSDDKGFGHGGRGGSQGERIKEIKADRVVLYTNVVKRFGRWEGIGQPVSKEYASHQRYYYALTYVGGAKYPSRMQAYDGYHRLTTNHGIGTYLLDQTSDNDENADSTWVEKLQSVAQWDFVYNDKGDISIERAYDTEGNLVYSFYPVKIGNRVAGTFTDAWGMPAKLRKDGGAQVVYITYDENGFESLYEYYDEQGYRQPNKDGAYMQRKTYRKDGQVLSAASCNITGQRMIDKFGNCGMQAVYDEKGRMLYEFNMDENWQPARVRQGNNPYYYNMIKRKYEYDKYDRVTKMCFVDLENKPDTNIFGIHAMELTYNDRGQTTSRSYRDLEGNLRISLDKGDSRWENEFDDEGRIVYVRNYGDAAKLSQSQYKEMKWQYDRDGNEISHLYTNFDGTTISSQAYVRTADGLKPLTPKDKRPAGYVEIRQFTADKQMVTIETNADGQQILWEYSDLEGNPIAPYGYWKNITTYEKIGDSVRVMTDYYVDTQNAVVELDKNNWALKKMVELKRNGLLYTYDNYLYNLDSTFCYGWRNYYDAKGNKIGEAYLNQYGNVTRRCRNLYHHVAVEYDIKGEDVSSYIAYNEYNEPAYLEDKEGVRHFNNLANGTDTYYDEYGKPISDVEAFRDSLPAVMSISVEDSVAYTLGLRDGDIILKYGDWTTSLKMQETNAYNWFYFKLIEFSAQKKNITVLRHHPEEKCCEVLTIALPEGTIQDLGIFPQLVFYTEKELQRHQQAVRDAKVELNQDVTQRGTHQVIIRKPNRIKGYIPTYEKATPYHYNPAIVLSMAKYVKRDDVIVADKYWNHGMGVDTLVNILSSSEELSAYYISVSTDLKTTYDGYPFSYNAHDLGSVYVDDELYARVMAVNDDFMQRVGSSFNSAYRQHQDVKATKKTVSKLTPSAFFAKIKKQPKVVYTPNALSYLNNEKARLPQCFKEMEMIYIGKTECPDLCSQIQDEMQHINATGYVKLPNFYSEDLMLVKADGENLYSEIFLIYFETGSIKMFYQKGLFSADELMAVQRTFGKKDAVSLDDGTDEVSSIPLIRAHTEQDGLARQSDMEGYYIVLEYNDWDISYGLNNFVETLQQGKEGKKHLVLMKIHWKEDNTFDFFDAPQIYEFGAGLLGMRMVDWNVQKSLYDRAASAYAKFKRTHPKDYKKSTQHKK